MRRNSLLISLCCSVLLFAIVVFFPFGAASAAESYPERPIHILVGYKAGGGTDRAVRLLQPFLEKELGSEIVVENIDGAGGLISATKLLRNKSDGYTIANFNQPHISYGIITQKTPFKFSDLTPMWVEVKDPIIMVVRKDSSWNDFADFVSAVRKAPGKYSVSLSGLSGQYANALWLKSKMDLDFKVVTYSGGSSAASALLGGHVDACFGDALSRYNLREDLKCLAIASPKPSPLWPEGKPFNVQLEQYDLQMPTDEFQARFGIYWVPSKFKKQYPGRYAKLVDAFAAASSNPKYREMAAKAGFEPVLVHEEGTGMKGGKNYMKVFQQEYKIIEDEIAPLFEKKD